MWQDARSSEAVVQRCSVKKGVLTNLAKFTGKHLRQSLFFNQVGGLRPTTLLKRRLWRMCFPVNFVKFLRTPFSQNTPGGCFCWNTYVNKILRKVKKDS